MPDLCPICMSPMVDAPTLPITEDPVLYDVLVGELGVDPGKGLSPAPDRAVESRAQSEQQT